MTLTEQLTDYVNAAFSGLWLVSQEPDEAEREIAALARGRGWKLAAWDVASGLRVRSEPGTFRGDAMPGDPLAVLRAVPALADRDGTALVLLHNFHKFLGNPEVVQTTFAQLVAGKRRRVAARFDEAVRLAEQAFASEFARLLSHLTARLANAEDGQRQVFRDSVINNLVEFFGRFSELNVRSNPELDALVEQAQRLVRGVTPQGLRDSDSLRQQVAADMARVRQQVEGLITDAPRRRLVRAKPSGNGGPHAATD